MTNPSDVQPPAIEWRNDCQGKKDFDGELVAVSTRYWPGNYRADGRPSAVSAIVLRVALMEGWNNAVEIARLEVNAPTEAEVKAKVEEWVREQYRALAAKLLSA